MFRSLARLFRGPRASLSRPIRKSQAPAARCHPRLEALEDRVVPAVLILTDPAANFAAGTPCSFTIGATSLGDAGTLMLTETGNLPGSIAFHDNGNGTATLSGTPALADVGSYPVTFTANDGTDNDTQNFNLTVEPGFSSMPGAAATVYLDFTGHTEASWSVGATTYTNVVTAPFIQPTMYQEIYQRVAEAYAPFNVNVTTVDPHNNAHGQVVTVAIGVTTSDSGPLVNDGSSGISNINGFSDKNQSNTCFVFTDNILTAGDPTNAERVATTAAHEAGHEFGLLHHTSFDAAGNIARDAAGNLLEYDRGDWSAATMTGTIIPIMGSNQRISQRHLWGVGFDHTTPTSGPVAEDDMNVIAGPTNAFGYVTTPIGHTLAAATALGTGGLFSASGILAPAGAGSSTQVLADFYTFTTPYVGDLSLSVSVPTVGATLDPDVFLLDSAGNVVVSDTTGAPLNKILSQTGLAAGTYYVEIWGHAATTTDSGGHVTTYPDVGSYFLNLAVTTTPPVTISDVAPVLLPVRQFFNSTLHQTVTGDTVYFNVQTQSSDANENDETAVGPEPLDIYAVAGTSAAPPAGLPDGAQPFAIINQWNFAQQVSYTATQDNVYFFAALPQGDADESATIDAFVKPVVFGQTGLSSLGFSQAATGVTVQVLGSVDPSINAFTDPLGMTLLTAGLGNSDLALDPPDANYKVIVAPVTPSLPPLTAGAGVTQAMADAGNALLANLTQQVGLNRAMLTTENRVSGAQQAGDGFWVSQQEQALNGFSSQLGVLLNRRAALLTSVQAALQASGLPTTLTATQVSTFLAGVSTSGLSSSAVAVLTELGVDSATVTRIQNFFTVQGASDLAGDAALKLTDPALVSALQTTGDSLGPGDPQPSNLAQIAFGFTHSGEFYTNFVNAAYQRYLGRGPDAGGLALWVAALENGLTDEALEAGFIGSAEYIANHGGQGAGWVMGMYKDLLGRTPSAGEVTSWVDALNNGVLTTQVAYGFAASAEREGQRITADYVTYLGRAPEPGVIPSWVSAFQSGTSNEDVIAGFVGSAEFYDAAKSRGHRADWVEALYLDVLHRAPSPGEIQGWIAALQ